MCQLAVVAQNYDRYNFFHDEAVKLKNEGKLNEAKEKFKKIKVICQGGIPQNNDLDKMIRECTTINLSESNLQFEARGAKSKSVTVRANAETFRVNSDLPWCKVAKKGNSVAVSCENNESPNPRSATVTVVADGKSVSFEVSQNGGRLEFEAQPDSVHFSKLSETVEIAIVTNATSWQVDSVPDWIEYRSNDTMLYLTSMQNNLATVRAATVFVGAANESFPIMVVQAESDTLLSVDKEVIVFPSKTSKDVFVVNSNVNEMQVQSPDEWINASISRDTVRVQVEANGSFFPRYGSIRIESGKHFCDVPVDQMAYASPMPTLESEIKDGGEDKGSVWVKSVPTDLKVTIIDDGEESSVRYTPFGIPVDYGHYSLLMGFERKEVLANNQQQDVVFEPGLRFATLTWSPNTAVGMMSGYVGAKSFGAYGHFQANTPFVSNFVDDNPELAGYNIVFGPVYRPNQFPYVGAYAGVGVGGYVQEPHFGFDYEAGVMGFYKNIMLTMGFHTSRISSSVKNTGFTLGVGGYLKRYYDTYLGYCTSDSRRWISLNYVFRPSENGKGVMVGDVGKDKVRVYFKALYLQGDQAADSLMSKEVEGSLGVVFTPVNSLIDMCLGVSGTVNVSGLDQRFQGIGLELGTILNLWRFPLTVFLHESDLFGERHLYVDFGIGFHLGEFEKSKCSYQ
jgi:hypothetical protein